MADDVTIPTTGTGSATPVIATDDVGGRHFQRVKVVWGVDGTATDASVTNPVPVQQPAIVRVQQTPTVSTSPAYTAKDAVGGLLTFANAARVSGGSITVQSVTVEDKSQQMPALDLVLFDRTFTAPTDNSIFDPTDAELDTCIGVIPISAWADFNDNSIATRFGLGLAATLNGTSLFGALVTRGTPTFVATTDIVVTVQVEQR